MNPNRFDQLEVLVHTPDGAEPAKKPPLLFIHGAYAGAWCWDEHFLPWFAKQGYSAFALSLSGHGESPGRARLDQLSIADYVADVAHVVARMPAPPVLIGHSMGGYVIQKLLEVRHAPIVTAAVLLCAVPPQGLMGSTLHMMMNSPHHLFELNRMMVGSGASIGSISELLFAQPIGAERLRRFLRASQPESFRAIWDMTLHHFALPKGLAHIPALVLGAEQDRVIAAELAAHVARPYGVEARILKGFGHAMMLERDWLMVAQEIYNWLEAL